MRLLMAAIINKQKKKKDFQVIITSVRLKEGHIC